MPKRTNVVTEQLDELRQDLEDLWAALTRDPKKQARKEQAWTLLAGVAAAGATMAARRLAAKLWPILTGEQPPTAAARPQPRPAQHEERRTEEPVGA